MPPSANPRRSFRAAAVPLLLSLAVHGLLLLALWCWPARSRSRSPALAIESTRISLDTCLLDPGPPALRPGRERPADSLGPNASIDFQPQLIDAPPLPVVRDPLSASDRGADSGQRTADGGSRTTGSLFPLPPSASSVVYVLDRSVSMGINNKLDLACRELLASLRRLPSSARFQIIAYNTSVTALLIDRQNGLLAAEPPAIDRAAVFLDDLSAAGQTDHANALRRGLTLHPDVLYFITDAGDLKGEDVRAITQCNRGTAIHAIELTRRSQPLPDSPLMQLVRDNHGAYRRVSPGD